MSKSLVDEAKKYQSKRKHQPTAQEIELALAWARGEVSLIQANQALLKSGRVAALKGAAVYSVLALALAEYVRQQPSSPNVTMKR